MYYLTGDMARTLESNRPYANLKSYFEYKQRGQKVLQQHIEEIKKLAEESQIVSEEEAE